MLRSAVIMLMVATVAGCSMRVQGVVRDEETGLAITGASIVIGNRQTTTNAAGRYRLGAAWQRTTMTVGAPGYEPQDFMVDPGGNRYPQQDVVLRRLAPAAPRPAREVHDPARDVAPPGQ